MIKLILICLIFSNAVHADDFGGGVIGSQNEFDIDRDLKDVESVDNGITEAPRLDQEMEKYGEIDATHDPFFPTEKSKILEESKASQKLKASSYGTFGSSSKQGEYLELDREQFMQKVQQAGEHNFAFSYIQNNYKYQSNNDVFKKTYEEGFRHVKGGMIHAKMENYIFRSFINMSWGFGLGVGHNRGTGKFLATGETSDALFQLWEVPFDFGLSLEIPLTRWMKIAGTGGASGMTLMQNRSDFENSEKGKRKIQFSPGYFASAQFKLSLTDYSKEWAYSLFTDSDITKMYLVLEGRMHNYSQFQDKDIQISGTSFGLGFSVEYL